MENNNYYKQRLYMYKGDVEFTWLTKLNIFKAYGFEREHRTFYFIQKRTHNCRRGEIYKLNV